MLRRTTLIVVASMWVLAGLLLAACVTPTPVEIVVTATPPPTEVPTIAPTEVATEFPDDVRAARDAALAYVMEHYGDQAPAPDLSWTEERTTPEGLVGASTYKFTSGDWIVTLSHPVVPPEMRVYQVMVANQTTGFQWQGEVGAAGRATELPTGAYLSYTNADYGFSFRYPSTWALLEEPGRDETALGGPKFAPAVKLSQGTLTLIIGYKRATEDVTIEAGAAAGAFETQGAVIFLGQEVPREVLVFEGKHKAVYYKGAGAAIQAGDLEFGISLQDFGADYQAIDIPNAVQAEVDQIIESFEFVKEISISGTVFQPLSPAACSDLAKAMAQTLGVDVATVEAPFKDYVYKKEGTGCQAKATGTGLDFESLGDIAFALIDMLEAQGWRQENRYAAGGPTGDLLGFSKDNGLCLLQVSWKPSDEVECPPDQPIAACAEKLSPEQRIYNIVLNCAQEPEYAGWKTYTSEKFGYTLKYPGDATVMGADLDEGVQFVGPLQDNEHWPWLAVQHPDSEFYRPPAGTDVHEWVADLAATYDEIGSEVEIAGLPAVHLIQKQSPQAYASDEIYFIRGDQLFHITILHAGGRQDWELYNTFLKSFTFP